MGRTLFAVMAKIHGLRDCLQIISSTPGNYDAFIDTSGNMTIEPTEFRQRFHSHIPQTAFPRIVFWVDRYVLRCMR